MWIFTTAGPSRTKKEDYPRANIEQPAETPDANTVEIGGTTRAACQRLILIDHVPTPGCVIPHVSGLSGRARTHSSNAAHVEQRTGEKAELEENRLAQLPVQITGSADSYALIASEPAPKCSFIRAFQRGSFVLCCLGCTLPVKIESGLDIDLVFRPSDKY